MTSRSMAKGVIALAPFTAVLLVALVAPFLVAQDDPADLPKPLTAAKSNRGDPLEDLDEGPIKPQAYRWMIDDPLTPTSQSTIAQFLTQVDDVDPNDILERPGLQVGWYTAVDFSVVNARISDRQQSGTLLNPPFASPVAPPFTSLDWMVMPQFTLGYRRPEGLGELSASYRFLFTQGDGTDSQFNGTGGNVSSRLQLHVLDLDYTLSDLFPNDLWLVPRHFRLTGGVRVAGIDDKTSASGGNIQNQSASNTFIGAGPRFALETFYPVTQSGRWEVFGKVDAAGIVGNDRQTFSQTTTGFGGASASASNSSTTAVPVVGLRAGGNWYPDWGCRNVKLSAGYQFERWYYLGASSDSYNELTIQGPFVRGEFAF